MAVEVGGGVLGGGLAFVDLVAEAEEDIAVVFGDVIESEGVGVPDIEG